MIFLTVGSHEPFDRLVEAVDLWCAQNREHYVFGQITERARYKPRYFEFVDALTPEEYKRKFKDAEFIISHAGMGSILTALLMTKRILVLPRRSDLGETRNDHQIPTAEFFSKRGGVYGASSERQIALMLDKIVGKDEAAEPEPISEFAEESLISAIAEFIRSS